VITGHTVESLLAFEDAVADEFATGTIKAPVHLSGGNEQALIDIFADVQPDDWVLGGWRSHYHSLLKGVPEEELREKIRKGHSVALTFPKQKVLCSGIVGGVAPIAVGLAWSLKRKNDENPMGHETRVWAFLGDMTAQCGIVHEAMKYASGHNLPIRWVVEDNGVSVCTDTAESWGEIDGLRGHLAKYYRYRPTRPHCGIGKWVAIQ
jgi:TPP-dependent pyruvate/acetoin dehydrogenase alpha subunit